MRSIFFLILLLSVGNAESISILFNPLFNSRVGYRWVFSQNEIRYANDTQYYSLLLRMDQLSENVDHFVKPPSNTLLCY